MSFRGLGAKARRSIMVTVAALIPIHAESPKTKRIAAVAVDNSVFAVPLATAIIRSAKIHLRLPDVVYKCFVYLHEKALHEEGIFRLTGSVNDVKQYKEAFNKGEDVDLSQQLNVHSVSGILKMYLRELPEPLMPDFAYKEDKVDQLNEKIKSAIAALPPPNRCLLGCLCRMLYQISQNEAETKMGIRNLVIIFSTALNIRSPILSDMIAAAFTYFQEDELVTGLTKRDRVDMLQDNEVNLATEIPKIDHPVIVVSPSPAPIAVTEADIFGGDDEPVIMTPKKAEKTEALSPLFLDKKNLTPRSEKEYSALSAWTKASIFEDYSPESPKKEIKPTSTTTSTSSSTLTTPEKTPVLSQSRAQAWKQKSIFDEDEDEDSKLLFDRAY